MDFNATYILNSEYILRADKNRIILASRKESDHSKCIFIHPVWALVLSYFDGSENLNETIHRISNVMSVSEEEIICQIKPFVENTKEFCIQYADQSFWFPEQILMKNEKQKIRNDLDRETFLIEEPYDFKTIRLNMPLSVMLVLNTTCVTDCIYCYADKMTQHTQMTADRVLDLIDEAYVAGIKSFDLSGGEVFTFKGWDCILQKLYNKGYQPYLSTKVPLTKKEIDRLYETGARKIQISLDALNPQLLCDTLRVRLDYADRIKETICYLDKKGFNIIIKSVLTRSTCTLENLKQLVEFMRSVPNIRQYTYTPVGYSHYKSIADFHTFKPTMDQITKMNDYFERLRQTDLPFALRPDTGAVSDGSEWHNMKVFNGRAICSANVYEMVILPDGQVTICEELYWNPNFIIGNINRNTLQEIWQSDKAVALWRLEREKFPFESACHDCDVFESCRYNEGVCWKDVIACYGKENWLFPDSRCPRAPKPLRPVFYDNSFITKSKI